MKSDNHQDTTQVIPQQFGYSNVQQQEDDIDLFEIFASICSQWKLLVAITLIGTLLTVIYALSIPRQYEVSAIIAPPIAADIKALNIRGYEKYTSAQIFKKYFDQLRSAEHLKTYLKKGNWYQMFFPDAYENTDENKLFSSLYSMLKISDERENENRESSVLELVKIKIAGTDEERLVKLANDYLIFTNNYLLKQIKEKGTNSVSLEIEHINQSISVVRTDAKVRRELLITKLEERNQELIDNLGDEKELLLTKSELDKKSRIALLEEAHAIAKQVGIKKLTTINSLATENVKAQTIVSLSGSNNKIYALMGTDYLNSELKTLKNRKNSALFIPEIAQIMKKIDDIKHDEKIIALKERKSDDPYIIEIPTFLKKIDQLKQLSFDFSNVQLYRLNQGAYADGVPEKPNRSLIVAMGGITSGFISLFVVLIVNGIKKHREMKDGAS